MIVNYASARDEAVILMRYETMRYHSTPVADDLLACRMYPQQLTWLQRALGSMRNLPQVTR